MAILVSLAASFLKDTVQNLAAKLSGTYRVKKIEIPYLKISKCGVNTYQRKEFEP